MKTLIILLVLCQSILTACGSVADAINNASKTQSASATATSTETAVTEKTTTTTSSNTSTTVKTKVEAPQNAKVTVDVNVSNVPATTQEAASADNAVYSSELMKWQDAYNSTPEGHHMATRAEIIKMIDTKTLPKMPANTVLWSCDENNQGEYYYVLSTSGGSMPVSRNTSLSVVYVKGEEVE